MSISSSKKRRLRRQKKKKHDAERREIIEKRARHRLFSELAKKPRKRNRIKKKLQDQESFTNEEGKVIKT